MAQGRLVLVATPLGNLGDLSPRAADALSTATQWAVEDTRVSASLQRHLGLKRPMTVLNDHTPHARLTQLVDAVEAGETVAVLSDAGTPAVSDPGAELVDACHVRGLVVDATPGPSAVTTALSLSGFYAQRFAFLGFLPRKPGPMREVLFPFAESTLTLVFFESPFRVEALLRACADTLGDRRYAVCRELTKIHQQVWRGRLPQTPTEKEVTKKGEFTVVVEGNRRRGPINDNEDA
ncbi:MAG: 16S rRNA (cytidine(1402)-2'-O)-methyltransferase [Fimbriimonadaceae bacterium]|nr:16S rRNA (cytidine(1402)-2'-O)-methyltransferase [Fimbriimonadaceae bacterium]